MKGIVRVLFQFLWLLRADRDYFVLNDREVSSRFLLFLRNALLCLHIAVTDKALGHNQAQMFIGSELRI